MLRTFCSVDSLSSFGWSGPPAKPPTPDPEHRLRSDAESANCVATRSQETLAHRAGLDRAYVGSGGGENATSAWTASGPWPTPSTCILANRSEAPVGGAPYAPGMASKDQVLRWARQLVQELRTGMRHRQTEYGNYWEGLNADQHGEALATATSAVEFLRRHAGERSEWYRRAREAYEGNARIADDTVRNGVRAVSDLLARWIMQIETGAETLASDAVEGARAVASTDIMEQVRQLNSDSKMHPAAAVVLAGAALEVALRSAVDELELQISSKPGISAYSSALRAAEVISKQDAKDLEQMGGLRNSAAHGELDAISRERSGLMEQQVNFFLARLGSILEAAPRDASAQPK